MSKMMDKWLQKAKPGDEGLTRPPVSTCVSVHKNEVRSITRGYFQNQFRVSTYKQEEDVLDENEEKEGEEDEDEDGEKVEDEVLEEGDKRGRKRKRKVM